MGHAIANIARAVALASVGAAFGCASTSPKPAFGDVAAAVQDRTGHAIRWNLDTREDGAVRSAVLELLRHELTADQAVQIALLNNRALQATYEELSVSQADLVEAGLLKNPVFSAGMATAERDQLAPNLVLGVAWDFLDLLTLPGRLAIASTELARTKLRVENAVLGLAADVRSAFFALQGAERVAAMRRIVADAAQASFELALRQHQSGNISELALLTEQGTYEQIRLELTRSEAETIALREQLTRLLGLWGPDIAFRISSNPEPLPKTEIALDNLEGRAIAERLDLAALRREKDSLESALSLVKTTRFLPGVSVGADAARLRGGTVVVAPKGSLELPIFNQHQAEVARLEASVRRIDREMEDLAVAIRSEVRLATARVVFARKIVEQYQTVLVPLREKVVELSQEEYGAMLLGIYQLILAKENEVSAYRGYIEATRDYWTARSDLERAVGARQSSPAASPSQSSPKDIPGATTRGAR